MKAEKVFADMQERRHRKDFAESGTTEATRPMVAAVEFSTIAICPPAPKAASSARL